MLCTKKLAKNMKLGGGVAVLSLGVLLGMGASAQAYQVTGFRSAQFGQKEPEVIAAAMKDLGVKREAIEKKPDEALGVSVLSAKVVGFAPLELPATVNYVFGNKCNCLMQVNIVWAFPKTEIAGVRKKAMRGVGALVGKFMGEKWGKDETLVSRLPKELKEGEESIIVFFRGQSADGSAITLAGAPVKLEKTLQNKEKPDAKGGGLVANVDKLQSVSLVYEKDTKSPDVARVNVNGF